MIFNLFKSKPTLKELIPKGFVDIHSHILPGIDDGAKNVEESLELILEMKKMGFSKIIGTPHIYPGLYNNSNESIKESFEKLSKRIDSDIKVDYASEYMLDYSIIQKARKENLICIKDNYVLIELSYIAPPIDLFNIIFELKINGYKPILAHPERYTYFKNDFNKFYKLKKHGCEFQMNILSLSKYYGKNVLDISKKLINEKLIDYIASDIHNLNQINSIGCEKCMVKDHEEIDYIMRKSLKF